jgi:LPXTG-motif cell wall-anchored protein
MRKTLVVGALIVSSVLLLQAPAWAPNLYRITQDGPQAKSSKDDTKKSAAIKATSDCISKEAKIDFDWGESVQPTSNADGDFSFTLDLIPKNHGKVKGKDVKAATCAGQPMELPLTGAATAPLLAFGVSLLVAGALLLLLSRRREWPMR